MHLDGSHRRIGLWIGAIALSIGLAVGCAAGKSGGSGRTDGGLGDGPRDGRGFEAYVWPDVWPDLVPPVRDVRSPDIVVDSGVPDVGAPDTKPPPDLGSPDTGPPACPDSFEPNNVSADAKLVTEDIYSDLTCCGDPDWYKIDLNEGDKLEVEFEFVHADGDLDMWIFDQNTVDNAETFSCENALACSTTETDDESAVVESIPADGTYYILSPQGYRQEGGGGMGN